MGGFAGHMSHLHENPSLTFKQIKDVFVKASTGELEGTEKTDGQNLYMSYSVKTGEARAVRNKGNILAGGMNAEQLAQKFADHPNPNIKEVFTDAFDTFEKAVQSLDPETQIKIFGADANVFYNSEIQDPRTQNVIRYDQKLLNIHQVGHVLFDKETKQIKTKGFKPYYNTLIKALEKMQDAIQDRDYNVQGNAVRRIQALDDDVALDAAILGLETELRKSGISDNHTIADYIVANLVPFIDQQVELPEENKKKLLRRLFREKGVTFNHVVKGLDRDVKERVRAIIKNEKNIMKSMILPIEEIVHDFSVEMLKGVQSFFVLDNSKEVMRLRAEVQKAITAIENSGNEEALRILQEQLRKLKGVENVTTATEGFVFDYDGHTYKFTGNFAPINQILGLFKYGRGNVPALQALDEEEANTADSEAEMCEAVYVTIPGAFKPPHRGHYQMVEHYAKLFPNGTVTVLVSPLAASERKGFDAATQADVGVKESLGIWNMYVNHLTNVTVIVSDMRSPVQATYEFVGNEGPLQKGDCVMPGASTKGGDEKRWSSFAKGAQKYAKDGVAILDPIQNAFTPQENLSATDLRVAMKNGDVEGMKAFLPDHIKDRAGEILNILGISSEPSQMLEGTKKKGEDISSLLYGIIEEMLNERDYQKQSERIRTHVKRREELVGTGPQDPGEAYSKPRPKKRAKSGPPGFAAEDLEVEDEDASVLGEKCWDGYKQVGMKDKGGRKVPNCVPLEEEEELEEMSSMAGGAVEGGAGNLFMGLDTEEENEKEKKRSRLAEEELIERIANYLLGQKTGV